MEKETAMKILKELHGKSLFAERTALETLIPELRGDEDEKIRKALVDALNKNLGNGIEKYGTTLNAALSWLEKQGSNSVKWQKNTPHNKPAINHSVLMKTIQGIAEGEWQGEDWFQYRWSWTLKDSDVLAWMELSNLDEQGEQKQEWSEEDENMANDLIEGFLSSEKAYHLVHTSKEVSEWLKSIKDRMQGKED